MTTPVIDLEDFWEDLLAYVEERRVIPVIGPELSVVEVDGETAPLHRLLAARLADRLHVNRAELAEGFGVNEVACHYIQARGRREDVYAKLRAVAREMPVACPEVMRQLARIRDFDLFVTLGFDSLLVEALNAERFAGSERTQHLGYSPGRVTDLPCERARLPAPVVYSLFGKLSVAPDYVLTDEDLLEFLSALQSESRRPPLLFDELKNNHLLFLGCDFPDWLARFVIRMTKSRQLSAQRGEFEILVNRQAAGDRNLVVFLENFSYGTRIVASDAGEFVAELSRRWLERHPPQAAGAAAAPAGGEPEAALPEFPEGGIFLSYAKEDHDAALRLATRMENLGLDVWFDKDRLEAGDQYDAKIRRNIKACSLFLPLISRSTERRVEGYFRKEWRLAEERSLSIAEHVPFIVPVVVDDMSEYSEAVPEALRRPQWTRLPDGVASPEFEARLVKLVREFRKRALAA